MKNVLSVLLLLISFGVNAQNRLADLYTLNPGDHYPGNMPRVKQWINSLLNPIFIRNLQYSDNITSSSKFITFNPSVRAGAVWPLGVGGLAIVPNTSTLTGQYDQDILGYLRSFDITTFDYKNLSYFLMAKTVLRISDEEMVANTLNFFVENEGKKSNFHLLIDRINKAKKEKLPYPANDNVREVAAIINKKYPGKVSDVLFDSYIAGKTDELTLTNMQRFFNITGFFNEPLKSRIDDLMSPKFAFRQDKAPVLQLPAQTLKLMGKPDSVAKFTIAKGSAVLNYHERQLEVIFNGTMNGDADPKALNVLINDPKKGKGKTTKLPASAKPQVITELRLIIDEKGIQLIGTTPEYSQYLIINQAHK